VCNSATIGADCEVGPFAYLRPGARLAAGVKVGTYVEVKASDIGTGSKVPHLSYVGDATIGEYTNIGAATVFVNYDGVGKHHSTIGSYVRTGADNMFVAPVSVGDGAYTAAGSVIDQDVPPGALGIARARQQNVAGWVAKRRSGTAPTTRLDEPLKPSKPPTTSIPPTRQKPQTLPTSRIDMSEHRNAQGVGCGRNGTER
jgi:bifunctional UDP-N-acetylglucosamine pyrophosphorylase/glucosamine-1-phosphate N-acetyltransferase